MKKGFPITLEGFGIPQSSKALHLWLKRLKDSLRQKGVIKADVLDCEFLVDHASPKFDNESRDKDNEAYRKSQRVKGKGGGKGQSQGKGKGKGKGGDKIRTFDDAARSWMWHRPVSRAR